MLRSHAFSALTVLAVLTVAGAAHADLPAPAPEATYGTQAAVQAAFMKGLDAAKANDLPGARRNFTAALDDPAFGQIPPRVQYAILYLLGATEFELKDYALAYEHLTRAGQTSPDLRELAYWRVLLDAAGGTHRPEALADSLTDEATNAPATLSEMDSRMLSFDVYSIQTLKDDARTLRVLEALRAAHFQPNDPFITNEAWWMDLIRLYGQAGRGDEARALAASLSTPESVAALQSNKLYADYAPKGADAYTAAVTTETARLRAAAAAHPDRLEGANALASRLMSDGRLDEALSVIDAALAKTKTNTKSPGKSAFTDQGEQLEWAYFHEANILAKLGRWDNAVAAQVKSRNATSWDTISQKVNLGDIYYETGKPAQALDAVKSLTRNDGSPYGNMASEEVRACAYAQQGKTAELAISMAFMKAHAADGYGPLRSALQCAGDSEGLAHLIVTQLDDPQQRAQVLKDAQTWLPDPHPTPFQVKMTATRDAAMNRPEVRAAIDKYGVINTYPSFRSGN